MSSSFDSSNCSKKRLRRHQQGGIIFWALIVLVGAAIGALVVFWSTLMRLEARLLVVDAPLKAYVDEPLKVRATVLNDLDIELREIVSTTVPVDEVLSVPVEQPLELIANFDAVVPIRMDVPVNDKIILEQNIDIDTIVEADLLGETFHLPLRGSFPVRAEVPVRMVVPIDQPVHMAFTAPIRARLKQNLIVPLKTDISADIPLHTRMTVPILNDLEVTAELPKDPPLDVTLNYSDLLVSLGKIAIGFDTDNKPADSAAATDQAAEGK